jgi:hypothetical protein
LAALPTLADLAAAIDGVDWSAVVRERVSHWAASYFDDGQALWAASREGGAYAAWRSSATHDLTPELMGLRGFAAGVVDSPAAAPDAVARAVARLGLPEAALELYFHRLLAGLGGWAQLARFRLWRAQLSGGDDATLTDLLAIRLAFETALLDKHEAALSAAWDEARAAYAAPGRGEHRRPHRRAVAGRLRARRAAPAVRGVRVRSSRVRATLVRTGAAEPADGLLHRRALGSVPARAGEPRRLDPHAGLRRVLRPRRRPPPLRLGCR